MKNVRGYKVFLFFFFYPFVSSDAAHSSRCWITSGAISTLFLIHPLARLLPRREEEGRSPPPPPPPHRPSSLSFVSSSPHESVPTSLMTYSGIHDDNRKLKALRLRPGRKTSMTTSDPHPVNQLWESNACTRGPL